MNTSIVKITFTIIILVAWRKKSHWIWMFIYQIIKKYKYIILSYNNNTFLIKKIIISIKYIIITQRITIIFYFIGFSVVKCNSQSMNFYKKLVI